MAAIHHTLGSMGSYYTFLMGLWGLFRFLRRQPPDGNFNGALIIAQGLFTLQAVIGVVLVLTGQMPGQGLHFLYGVSTFLALPLAYTWARGRNDTRASLIFGLALMFTWGLTLRAFDTALPPH
jgi:heme A synthase